MFARCHHPVLAADAFVTSTICSVIRQAASKSGQCLRSMQHLRAAAAAAAAAAKGLKLQSFALSTSAGCHSVAAGVVCMLQWEEAWRCMRSLVFRTQWCYMCTHHA
jgi:hypothetical protein